MLAALALILNSVASINIGPYVKIGFSGIPNQIADYLFGPITGCLFAGVLDIVKFFIRPDGPFFFGFTFNAMLAAFIYGCFYYKHKLTFRRVLIAKLVVVLIVNVLLNTLWLDKMCIRDSKYSNSHSDSLLGNGCHSLLRLSWQLLYSVLFNYHFNFKIELFCIKAVLF